MTTPESARPTTRSRKKSGGYRKISRSIGIASSEMRMNVGRCFA
jgi:hypothetical protein